MLINKGDVLLKVISEKVKFSNCAFCNIFYDYEWTLISRIIQNIFNDVDVQIRTEGR